MFCFAIKGVEEVFKGPFQNLKQLNHNVMQDRKDAGTILRKDQ
jgi:hypothetical protein